MLRTENPYINQRRIADPPQRVRRLSQKFRTSVATGPEPEPLTDELADTLFDLLALLPPDEQQLMRLRFEGYDAQEIADRLAATYETGILEEEAQIHLQNSKELKERSRTLQWNATSDIAFDHLDSLDAARDTSTSSKNNEIFNNL